LELFDQIAREQSGGEMLAYLRQYPLPNEDFVYNRIGEEGRYLVRALRDCGSGRRRHSSVLRAFARRLSALPGVVKRCLTRALCGADGTQTLRVGRFRRSGEAHQWMYDRYSLARLLRHTGFRDMQLQDAGGSQIPDWPRYHLDTLPDGRAVKPDLFFMEAIKPTSSRHERSN
jgi:hypothetical protein